MRPIKRTPWEGGEITKYQQYLTPLIEAFGQYCSYCERLEKCDVEHVVPKSKNASLALDWNNCLLGCARCNRDFKRSHNDSREGYVWPDTHDTFSMLRYFPDGRVKPQQDLNADDKKAVSALIHLVRLDDGKERQVVLNLARRRKFKVARLVREDYIKGFNSLDEVIDMASEGFWSVWMTVFKDRAEVIERLCHCVEFPNTRNEFFG